MPSNRTANPHANPFTGDTPARSNPHANTHQGDYPVAVPAAHKLVASRGQGALS